VSSLITRTTATKGIGVDAGDNLIILGASARAAAFSALRAGLRPWCIDLFADRDLQGRCPVMRLPPRYYPDGFLETMRTELPGPWIYTGGMENRPDLVRRMARRRPLWGNGREELRRARDPLLVRRALLAAGLPAPAIHARAYELPPSGRWLRKPYRGCGGAGIRFWAPGSPGRDARSPGYFQEFIDGDPCAALYVADGRRAWLLGLTRQLVGVGWAHAAPFGYCGSVGPLEIAEPLREELARLGRVLTLTCGLRGLFGVDGVLRDDRFWAVEVNPRYTASVEVHEYATGIKMLDWHAWVFTRGALPRPAAPPAPPRFDVGKAVLFARTDLVFPTDGPWSAELRSPTPPHEPPSFADIPAAGERIAAGRPVLTFFTRAASASACLDALQEHAADLDRWLFGT
jgi:predicted ATP-grasp superfamily ATP-dependent carboligase